MKFTIMTMLSAKYLCILARHIARYLHNLFACILAKIYHRNNIKLYPRHLQRYRKTLGAGNIRDILQYYRAIKDKHIDILLVSRRPDNIGHLKTLRKLQISKPSPSRV